MNSHLHDYREFLKENGLTDGLMEAANRAALVDETPCENLAIAKSGIAGQGAFATRHLVANQIISKLRSGDRWTLAGRFVNHSPDPNTAVNPNGELIALKPIAAGEELTANYRQVKCALEKHWQ